LLEIPRCLARQLRAVFRRCVAQPAGMASPVEFRTGADGLLASISCPEVTVAYRQPGNFPEAVLRLPLAALADFAGGGQDLVTLEAGAHGGVSARWQDAGVPQFMVYDAAKSDRITDLPGLPEQFVANPPELLGALAEALRSAARDGIRFAFDRMLLRAKTGEVVATDGRQLLIQGGFTFPWDGDVLVPCVPAFGSSELPDDGSVEVGRTERHVVLRVGPWIFYLGIYRDGRFPDVNKVVPKVTAKATCWRLDPEDAAYLARALSRLPGKDDDHQPVTVDLNGQAYIRSRSAGQGRATEVVLSRSDYAGPAVQFCVDRRLLARVFHLRLDEICVVGPEAAMLCRGEQRTFVFMPLSKDEAIGPSDDALRVVPPGPKSNHASPSPQRKR